MSGMLLAMASGVSGESVSSKGVGIMGTRGFSSTAALGSTTGKEAIVSFRIELPYGVSPGWKLAYLGFSDGTVADIEVDDVIITAEQPDLDDVEIRVKFGGANGATFAPSTVNESDAIRRGLIPGSVIRVATLYRNASGGNLPYQSWGNVTAEDEGVKTGNTGTLSISDELDRSGGNSSAIYAGVAAVIRAYYPMAIVGRPHSSYVGTEVCIGFIGDSINIQSNDLFTDPFATRGFNGRFAADDVPYVIFGQGGSNAGGFTGATGTALFQYLFGTGADDRKVTHIHDEYGINQLRNQLASGADAAAVWTSRLAVAAVCAGLDIPYTHCTLTPMGDTWLIGHANNGDAAAQFAHFVSERGTFNDQVRNDSDTITGCIGFFDWQEAVESDYLTNGNTWASGSDSGDTLHPGGLGHQRMAAKMSLATFTSNPNPLPT